MKKSVATILMITILAISFSSINSIEVEAQNVATSKQKFNINGQSFNTNALIIEGHNYLKIAEFTELLDIDIAYNEVTKTVSLDKTKPHSGVRQNVEESAAKGNFIVDGRPVNANTIIVNGYNYLKIVDFAEFLDIDISFDEATKTVSLDKTKPFSGVRIINEPNNINIPKILESEIHKITPPQ